MSMEWQIEGADAMSGVVIPEHLVDKLHETLQQSPAFLTLDRYQDFTIRPPELQATAMLLKESVRAREQANRDSVMHRLGLTQWQSWAEGALSSTDEKDEMLLLCRRLADLCVRSLAAKRAIRILGD